MHNKTIADEVALNENRLLSMSGLLLVFPLVGVFLLESFIFKALQMAALEKGYSIVSLIKSVSPDIAVMTFVGVFFAVCFSISKKGTANVYSVIYHLVMLSFLLLNAGSHGYFIATGSALSWSPIEYWINNMSASNRIISSSITLTQTFLLGGQILLVLVSAILFYWGPLKKWHLNRKPFSREGVRSLLIGASSIFFLTALVPPPSGASMALARNTPWSIIREATSSWFSEEGQVQIGEDERFGTDLTLKKRPGGKKPNIVFIIFESLSFKQSDVYVPGKGTTPFLEKLSKKSVVVERLYSVVPHTTKAVMSMLCGLYPYFETTPREAHPDILPHRCLAHILGDQGYQTAFFQTAGNFEKRSDLVANMGYQTFKGLKDMPSEGFESVSYFGAEDKMMIQPSMDWVDAVKDEPFFLTYLTLSTHHNYAVPQSFPFVEFDYDDKDLVNYMNAVRYIDSVIKEIFGEFEKRGLMDNTLFIIAGDHGEGFFEHGRRQHDLVIWEEGLRVTALLYGPQILGQPRTIHGVRSQLDWVPTVSDILGLEPTNGTFVGQSLLRDVPDDRKLFHSCWFRNQCMAVHEGLQKTIYFYGLRPMEVYDNTKDPFDENNLAFTGPYDQSFLDKRKTEMLRFKKVVDQQYSEWEQRKTKEGVTRVRPKVANESGAVFEDAVELVGYDITPKRIMAGQDIRLRYVFKCLKKLDSYDNFFAHFFLGRKFVNADHIPVGGSYPLHNWNPGEYIVDEHTVHVPGNWTEGELRVSIGFWNKRNKKRFKVKTPGSNKTETELVLAELPLLSTARSGGVQLEELRKKIGDWIGFEQPEFEQKVGVTFGNTVELVGVTMRRTDVELAGTVEMAYVFRALKDVPSNWRPTVKLIREDGVTVNGDHEPINGLYPVRYWRAGEYIVDKHRIHIDMYMTKIGTYTAYLGFRAGHRSIPAVGPGEIDDLGRVALGKVIIRKDHDPHLRH